jgi:co-chaperonin GroES (HSP10)
MTAKAAFAPHQLKQNKILPLNNVVIVRDMTFDQRTTSSGIVLLNDNGTSMGIRPRWGQVYATGPDQTDVQVGQWICVAHGRWTRGVEIEDDNGVRTIRKIDPKDILLVSNQQPNDDTMSDAIQSQARDRFSF